MYLYRYIVENIFMNLYRYIVEKICPRVCLCEWVFASGLCVRALWKERDNNSPPLFISWRKRKHDLMLINKIKPTDKNGNSSKIDFISAHFHEQMLLSASIIKNVCMKISKKKILQKEEFSIKKKKRQQEN